MRKPSFNFALLRPEDQLLLYCSRSNLDDETQSKITTLLNTKFDFGYLINKAYKHRLHQLLYYNLNISNVSTIIPEKIYTLLKNDFRAIAIKNNNMFNALGQITSWLQAEDIMAVPYKGPILARLVYGDVALRIFSDLDLYISLRDEDRAIKLLLANGFKIRVEHDNPTNPLCIIPVHETTFVNFKTKLHIDVNWLLEKAFDTSKVKFEDLLDNFIHIQVDGFNFLSFSPEDNLLALSLHAASHYWDSLLLLGDIAEIIRNYPNLFWDKIINKAKILGVFQIFSVSVILAKYLFEVDLPDIFTQNELTKRSQRAVNMVINNCFYKDVQSTRKSFSNKDKVFINLLRRDSIWQGLKDLFFKKIFSSNNRIKKVDPSFRVSRFDDDTILVSYIILYYFLKLKYFLSNFFQKK